MTATETRHAERHPTYVPGCFACKIRTISVAPSATPSRRGGAHARSINDTEKRWVRDHAAYRRLVAEGIQPKRLDGAADLEARADSRTEIEAGRLLTPRQREALDLVGGDAA